MQARWFSVVWIAGLAACAGGASSRRGSGPGAGGLDVGLAFAPAPTGDTKALEGFKVPIDKAKAVIDQVPEDGRGDEEPHEGATRNAYDFDRDGAVDLIEFPEVMFGPSAGWVVYGVEGGKPRKLVSSSGGWGEVRVDGGAVTLRFDTTVLAPGEPRFATLVRFAKGAWEGPIQAYGATQGKVPVGVKPPYGSFTTRGPATLRATPAVDDTPKAPDADDAGDEDHDRTTTLLGNVVARYAAAGAKGTVLAAEGTWRYVAFDPAVRPAETSLAHGMIVEEEAPEGDTKEHQLRANVWLCGWVAAAELDIK